MELKKMMAKCFCFAKNCILGNSGLREGIFPQNTIKYMLSSTTAQNNDVPLSTVDLAYASYESTAVENEKSPVIILHGFLGSKSNWNSLSKALHKNTQRKVLALDARNHGDSPHTQEHSYRLMSADVVHLMKKFEIQKANLLGHSMGGRTAMLTALMHPQLVSSVIVVDIAPVSTSAIINNSMSKILDAMEAVKIPPGISLAEARRLADKQLSSINDKNIRNFILTNLMQSSSNTYSWRLNFSVLKSNFNSNIAHFSLMDAEYTGPTRFICGEKSEYVRKDDIGEIKKYFPSADLHYIPDAGHWVHAEKPAAFLELAGSFLNNLH